MQIDPRLFRFAPLLAALVFGSWAAYVNSEYGMMVLVRTGVGQGVYALFSTWIVTYTTRRSFEKLGSCAYGLTFSFLSGFAVMALIPIVIHLILGTPEIILAIAPGLIWGSGFVGFYLWTLARAEPTTT